MGTFLIGLLVGSTSGIFLMALINANNNNEKQSLIDASRKSLENAENEIEEQKERIKDLENNVEFLFNNLSAQKKKLVIDGKSKN